jgi:hypothetical protein
MALPEIKVKITADTTNAEISIDRVIKSEKELALATTQAAQKMTALNAALAKGSITQKNYAREVAKVDREFDAAAASAARLVGATAQVTRTSAGAAVAATRTSGAMGRLGSVSRTTRGQIQNTSFQLQDIIVQLQMGTSATTALSQQLPQLAGGFGAVGAAIGVGVALGIPAVALAMNALKGESEDLEARMENLADLSDALSGNLDTLSLSVAELAEKYGDAAIRVQEFAVFQSQLRIAELTAALAAQSEVISEVAGKYTVAQDAGRNYRNTLAAIERDFGIVGEAARTFEDTLGDLANAEDLTQQVAALEAVKAQLDAAGVSAGDIPPEFALALSQLIDLSRETDGARAIADQLVEAVADIAPNLAPATDAATLLKEEMAAALALINEVNQQSSLTYSGRGGDPSSFGNDFTSAQGYQSPADIIAAAQASAGRSARTTPSGGGGGGGQERDPAIQALMESLKTEDEILEEWRADGLQTLANANADELAALGGHSEAKLRLEAQYQERLAGLRQGYNGDGLEQAKTFFGDMANSMQGGSEKMLRIAKVFGAAQSLINSYQAYTEVLKTPGLPLFARIPAAVAVLGAGLGMVSAIKGVSSGGGGGGGAAAASPSIPSAAAGGGTGGGSPTNVAISLHGGDMFGRDQVISLINSINEAVEDGAIVRLV